jgi:hypothetical protein
MGLAPSVSKDSLCRYAEEYLAQAHPSGSLPIPIDEIVSFYHKVEVRPYLNLRETRGIEGFVTRDCQTIFVDHEVMNRRNPYRFRFTLAHELSHILFHQRVFKAATFTDVDGWIGFIYSGLPARELREIEQQAYCMAGYLLVPRKDFTREYESATAKLQNAGADIKTLTPLGLKALATAMSKPFQVSWEVVRWQGIHENVWKFNDFPPT